MHIDPEPEKEIPPNTSTNTEPEPLENISKIPQENLIPEPVSEPHLTQPISLLQLYPLTKCYPSLRA
jgi:hypothetical protein